MGPVSGFRSARRDFFNKRDDHYVIGVEIDRKLDELALLGGAQVLLKIDIRRRSEAWAATCSMVAERSSL
jgi:hypothetical protein